MAFRQLLAVLVDLSGTIHIDDTEVSGSVQAVNRLKNSQLKVKFVTNTTKESKRLLLERLTKIGFSINSEEIFTSLTAARKLIDTKGLSPLMLLDDRALEEFKEVPQEKFDSVLVGLAPDKFNYSNMNEAFRLVLDGAPLIAIHKARYYKTKEGLALGPGPFVSALEYSTGRQAEIVGKPESSFFLSAVEDLGVQPEHCVMIGDDARDDIVGAMASGMKGILVKTGKYRDGDEMYLPENGITVNSFSEAVDIVLNDQSHDKT
ncbi:haloacid dehalogenase-like hydrolase domain-containing protein 2 isoform X2 [Mercenaria mercenaria]|nr:haloacid dehalogenase-like hydrolase domain-containing protein 2 isoform X2 [Mercenaria mercenaria]